MEKGQEPYPRCRSGNVIGAKRLSRPKDVLIPVLRQSWQEMAWVVKDRRLRLGHWLGSATEASFPSMRCRRPLRTWEKALEARDPARLERGWAMRWK